jgi:hypothetical protein
MFPQSLIQRTTGSDRFEAINVDITSEYISWSECAGICADEVGALTGYKKDFTLNTASSSHIASFIETPSHHVIFNHNYILYCTSPLKVVNFLKARPLKPPNHKSLFLH